MSNDNLYNLMLRKKQKWRKDVMDPQQLIESEKTEVKRAKRWKSLLKRQIFRAKRLNRDKSDWRQCPIVHTVIAENE